MIVLWRDLNTILCMLLHTHTHTQTHRHRHTHTARQTARQTDTHTQTHTHTDTHICTLLHMDTRMRTHRLLNAHENPPLPLLPRPVTTCSTLTGRCSGRWRALRRMWCLTLLSRRISTASSIQTGRLLRARSIWQHHAYAMRSSAGCVCMSVCMCVCVCVPSPPSLSTSCVSLTCTLSVDLPPQL